MARILVHVEGQTEETFVNEVLALHLSGFGHYPVARLIGNARQKSLRGGIRDWDSASRDIINHLKSDTDSYSTTMVDYYGLPENGARAWPGRAMAAKLPFNEKASAICEALRNDVAKKMPGNFDSARFIPYVMMHEFEALLFSDCNLFASGIGKPDLARSFLSVRENFLSPEEINDSPLTAPSKRIERIFPSYQKPLMGTLAVLEIGIEKLMEQCPHFNVWVKSLELLPE